MRQSTHTPEERGALFDEIRRDIPAGSSGLVALVGADETELSSMRSITRRPDHAPPAVRR